MAVFCEGFLLAKLESGNARISSFCFSLFCWISARDPGAMWCDSFDRIPTLIHSVRGRLAKLNVNNCTAEHWTANAICFELLSFRQLPQLKFVFTHWVAATLAVSRPVEIVWKGLLFVLHMNVFNRFCVFSCENVLLPQKFSKWFYLYLWGCRWILIFQISIDGQTLKFILQTISPTRWWYKYLRMKYMHIF